MERTEEYRHTQGAECGGADSMGISDSNGESNEDNLSDISDISVLQLGGDQQLDTLTETTDFLEETFCRSFEVKLTNLSHR